MEGPSARHKATRVGDHPCVRPQNAVARPRGNEVRATEGRSDRPNLLFENALRRSQEPSVEVQAKRKGEGNEAILMDKVGQPQAKRTSRPRQREEGKPPAGSSWNSGDRSPRSPERR